jgi:ABC-type molybdenum transport system ATPase subunit/photorepair protein PhrA
LWIKGKPGAGKSTLMKKILSHFQGSSQEFLIASYFFHGRGNNPLQKSPLGMMRSIVYQLLDQSNTLCQAFLPLFLD